MGDPFNKLRELELTRDEVNRIGEALKKEEFRKMLCEYVEEIQDPENKKLYEQEIIQLEKERGVDAEFIHPKPGYVIKSSVEGNQKCFINICVNDKVDKPTNSPMCKNGSRGLNWSLPHTLIPPRDDVDKKNIRCKIFDVLFHPDTIHLAKRNKEFYKMVNMTAIDAIEKNFHVNIDRKNLKYPKLNYKGMPHPGLIRKPSNEKPLEREGNEKEFFDKIYAEADKMIYQKDNNDNKKKKQHRDDPKSKYTTPKYLIKYRSHVDMEECLEHKNSKINAAIPKEIIIEINLPLLKSSTDITLDVTEKTLQLISEKPAKYKVNITLPYRVNQDQGNAKFDKDLKKLIVLLPVKRLSNLIDYNRDNNIDSGVDSDNGSPTQTTTETIEYNPPSVIEETTNSEPHHTCDIIKHETIERTNNNGVVDESDYMLPEFTCHLFETTLAFTLNVKNVDGNTINKTIESDSILIKFTSIGASFYPTNYSIYIKLPSNIIKINDVIVELWDNNVVLQIPLDICDNYQLNYYYYGINQNDVKQKYIEEPSILSNLLQNTTILEESEDEDNNTPNNIIEAPTSNNNNKNETIVTDEKESMVGREDSKPKNEQKSEAINIMGCSYESSGDELSASSYSPSKNKGILKRFSSNRYFVGRSISESSLDDFVCSSSVELDSSIPENNECSTSLKKTVRFNDTIMRQLYRSNSSILGQKKKNQRKARNKKRAQERRHSESEASELENNGGDHHHDNDKKNDKSDSENNDLNSPTENANDIFQMDIGF